MTWLNVVYMLAAIAGTLLAVFGSLVPLWVKHENRRHADMEAHRQFLRDWAGTAARPGVAAEPGVMARLADTDTHLTAQDNHLRGIDRHLAAQDEQIAEIKGQLRALRFL